MKELQGSCPSGFVQQKQGIRSSTWCEISVRLKAKNNRFLTDNRPKTELKPKNSYSNEPPTSLALETLTTAFRKRVEQLEIRNSCNMNFPGVPLDHTPSILEQYKSLIRHVHAEPIMMRRAMRLAFRSLPQQESVALRDWIQAHYSL